MADGVIFLNFNSQHHFHDALHTDNTFFVVELRCRQHHIENRLQLDSQIDFEVIDDVSRVEHNFLLCVVFQERFELTDGLFGVQLWQIEDVNLITGRDCEQRSLVNAENLMIHVIAQWRNISYHSEKLTGRDSNPPKHR